jgi:hypothetical protein
MQTCITNKTRHYKRAHEYEALRQLSTIISLRTSYITACCNIPTCL